MKCSRCNREVSANDKFCQTCGNDITKQLKKGKNPLKFILPIFAILIIVILAIKFLPKKENEIVHSDLTNAPENIKVTIEYDNKCKESTMPWSDDLYCYAEIEEYEEYVTLLNDICSIFCLDNIKTGEDGTIKDEVKRIYNLDLKNKDDNNYFIGMYYIYSDYKMAHDMFAHEKIYLNKDEARAKIIENTKHIRETWNLFLAHKDLDYDIEINGDDPFIYDGIYKGKSKGVQKYVPIYDYTTDENGKEERKPIDVNVETLSDEEINDVESWARNYKPTTPGTDGTYKAIIKEFASKFDITLDYNFDNIYDGCYGSTEDDVSSVFAAYCHATPTKIFINDEYAGFGNESYVNKISDDLLKQTFGFPELNRVFDMKDVRSLFTSYPNDLESNIFLDVLKHEMAHHLIGEICGTSQPVIARNNNVEIEAVTNSYAMIYLGASEYLDRFNPEEYHVTEETNRIAKEIHDNHICK
jgi:hypothetical protein